jgi:6-phosphofructokinase
MLGNAAPGGNNIIDGLLKYANQNMRTSLVGYVSGIAGVENDNLLEITEDSYAPYRNMGGYDYLGRSKAKLDETQIKMIADSCTRNGITGLILVGATQTLTIAVRLNEYFLKNNVNTNVVVIPATLNGNVKHKYF